MMAPSIVHQGSMPLPSQESLLGDLQFAIEEILPDRQKCVSIE